MDENLKITQGLCRTGATWRRALLVGAICWTGLSFAHAQEFSMEDNEAGPSSSGLLTQAGQFLIAENYAEAEPLLVDYLERMKESDDKRVHAMMQDVRLKLGKIRAQLEDHEGATTYFEDYLAHQPQYERLDALKYMAISCFELNNFEKSISTVLTAFAPPPVIEEAIIEQVKVETLDEEERGGVSARKLRRYAKQAEEAEEDEFIGAITDEKPKEKTEYTQTEQILLNMTLAESYTGLEDWAPCIQPYQFVIDHSDKSDRRGYAIMKQVRALIQLRQFEEVRTKLIELSNTEARYDVRVNMAMMSAATALFNEAEYDSALLLYRMVLPRADLAAYQINMANELRIPAGMGEMTVTVVTNEVGRIETLFGSKHAQASVDGTLDLIPDEIPPELVDIEAEIIGLMELAPYETEVVFRIAQLYAAAGRPWEALTSFDLVTARDPDSEQGIRAFCAALQALSDLKLYDRLETRALGFLDQHTEGLPPRQVAYHLTAAYQIQERMADIKGLRPTLDAFAPTDNVMALQYESELYYMQAIADLMLLNYLPAQEGFERVLATYPGSHQEDNIHYWHAMTQLFIQDYDLAFEEFERYLNTYPKGNWVAAAWFQSGICQFALEDYDDAMVRFEQVINSFPEAGIYPDACSMRGDLYGSKGLLDEAILDYTEAFNTAKKPSQATYAVFQMAVVFEVENRYEKIIEIVDRYLEKYDDEADLAKAAYWIGKTKIKQGLIDEAVAAYRDTIIKYGGDIRQDGVDLIINDLLTVTRRLKEPELKALKERLTHELRIAESATLQLRLRVLIANLNGTTVELGRTLLTEMNDLTQAPPPVLSVICAASFAEKDYSHAEEILTLFLNHFEDSDYMRTAYKLRAYDLYAQGELDEAMKIVNTAQALYGTDRDTAWAQLMKGRLELACGQADTARETFRLILTVRAWRGETYAEATYRLGEVEEQINDPKKAFAWYQRAYCQYKGHADGHWAAEGYLASARCLEKMGLHTDMRNTYRAMLYDKYVNSLPQAEVARQTLGPAEVLEIQTAITAGVQTNITVTVETEETP